jgi:SAM-dependent methyltransferase
MSWSYGTLASEVYDLAYPSGMSMGGDVEAYLAALEGVDGPVLEPAAGGGRLLIPLLQAGYDVTGYDLSPEMLDVCRVPLAEHGLDARVVLGDMTDWIEPAVYSAVVVPTGSLILLDGGEPTLSALRSFAACLKPGGVLAFDIPTVPLLAEPDPLRVWRRDDTVWTLQTMGLTADSSKNQTTRWLRYERWTGGKLDATELMPFRTQHWSEAEVRSLVAQAGLAEVVVTADHTSEPPGPDSELLTFLCRRPAGGASG